MENMHVENTAAPAADVKMKFCKYCGNKIMEAAVVCPHCGCQVEEVKHTEQPNIVINNSNVNSNTNTNTNAVTAAMLGVRAKNKWVAFLLCFFFGYLGAHRFYEERIASGLLYLFTFGLFGFGWFFDGLALLFKPNPYYVR